MKFIFITSENLDVLSLMTQRANQCSSSDGCLHEEQAWIQTSGFQMIVFTYFIGKDWLNDECLDLNVRETESLYFCFCFCLQVSSNYKVPHERKGEDKYLQTNNFPKRLHCLQWIYISTQRIVGTQPTLQSTFFSEPPSHSSSEGRHVVNN